MTFPKSKTKNMSGLSLLAMYDLKPTSGDVGIEVEVEGNMFKKQGIPAPWKYVKDGSLRGKDNAEYILNGPIPFDTVPAATETLWKMFHDHGSVLDESNRTSVHVHLNVQQWHINRLASFLCAYYTVEEILTEFCGEHRVGNLFCLRGKDAPGLVSRIRRLIKLGEPQMFSDGLHYGALNPQAIQKFGSVEIRTMRGAMSAAEINLWVDVLRRIYELSEQFPDPRNLVDLFSGEGPLAFLDMILGDNKNVILEGIPFDHQRVMQSLYDGILIAQDIAYCRDWEGFKALSVRADPFGRSLKSVAAALVADEVGVVSVESPFSQAVQLAAQYAATPYNYNPFTVAPTAPMPASAHVSATEPNFDGWTDEMIDEWYDAQVDEDDE